VSKLRVAVLYGGRSAEHEVSVVSARCVLEAIDRDRYDVVPIAVTKDGRWLLPERAPDRLPAAKGSLPGVGGGTPTALRRSERGALLDGPGPIDVVFPVLHGPGGEDGSVQGLLETLGVPYFGAGVSASAVGLDKSLQKPVFAAAGIPLVPWGAVRAQEYATDPSGTARRVAERIGFPLFTKPSNLGSSVGISKCRRPEDLPRGLDEAFRHDRTALVEAAIEGRELECAVLGNDEPEASVVGEIIPVNEFYDYEAKYLVEGSRAIVPAELPGRVAEQVREYSLRAFAAIGCAGMARVDFFLRSDEIFLNEINTIPGFTPISMFPKLWEASGIPYAKLIDRLIELALERSTLAP
jgi:D-alanine-D-alanine ligase